MNFLGFLLTQCLNALSQASLLFFIACGLTLIFGIMRIVNFAHGVIYMLGAYVGYTMLMLSGSFLLSLVPGTNETLTRIPPSHPLADAPLSPLVLHTLLVWFGFFVVGYAAQCRMIHARSRREVVA